MNISPYSKAMHFASVDRHNSSHSENKAPSSPDTLNTQPRPSLEEYRAQQRAASRSAAARLTNIQDRTRKLKPNDSTATPDGGNQLSTNWTMSIPSTSKMRETFAQYLQDYPDEIPRLGSSSFEIEASADDQLNCHNYAVGVDKGYNGPGDDLGLLESKNAIEEKIDGFYKNHGFVPVNFPPDKRTLKTHEVVVVFGLSSNSAKQIRQQAQAKEIKISDTLLNTVSKVSAFGTDIHYPTHSILHKYNKWLSKMGTGPVISIPTPECLGQGVYGEPWKAYKKPLPK